MREFSERLRTRALQLGVSHAELARRAGLSEQRFANYASGTREPDLSTLLRIAVALETSPNWLLAFGDNKGESPHRSLELRAANALAKVPDGDLDLVTAMIEAAASRMR